MKYVTLLCCITFLISGCAPAEKRRQAGELRHKLFVECMELSSKMPRQQGDDVAEIVSACNNQAFYTAKQITQ